MCVCVCIYNYIVLSTDDFRSLGLLGQLFTRKSIGEQSTSVPNKMARVKFQENNCSVKSVKRIIIEYKLSFVLACRESSSSNMYGLFSQKYKANTCCL